MTNPLINQFSQLPVQGQLDLSFTGAVVTAYVSANQATALIAGQAVKGDNTAPTTAQDGPPPVMALASAADPAIGFVVRNIKDINAPTYSRVELAMDGACMYMTASGAITRFSPVEYNTSTNQVTAWGGVNPIVGYAYDAAINASDLIRVLIKSPQLSSANTSGTPHVAQFTVTQAQINAGLTLIPGIAGKAITVTSFQMQTTGTFATGTSIELEDTNSSPVPVATIITADLGNVNFPGATGVTMGVGFGQPLTSGKGLQVVKNGSAYTGGTAALITITYTQA